MDKTEHLSKLKPLKIERSNGALFSSPEECMEWIDNVLPLLKYDQNHYDDFYYHAQYVRITTLSSDTLMSHLNPMIGIVSQAITELENNIDSPTEIVPVQNSAPNPANKDAENKVKFLSIPKGSALTRIAFEVVALVVGMSALLLVRQHLGIPL
jgi:hypothetical protein